MASKLCDSCKSATAALFCRPDSAFLCVTCDVRIHAANRMSSRHARVVICEVCEQAPAHVTCKADAASLCLSCDRHIHSANPVAQKHDRYPIAPFYDSVVPASAPTPFKSGIGGAGCHLGFLLKGDGDVISREEEEEAASWLLPNPKSVDDSQGLKSAQYLLGDADYGSGDLNFEPGRDSNCSGSDGVVPVQVSGIEGGFSLEFTGVAEAKGPHGGDYEAHYLCQSVSSSLEVGIVPDGSMVTDISDLCRPQMTVELDSSTNKPAQLSSADREARVLRYREKRKNRKFEKTIRYASRKAYAEMRPRIKGRFAKRAGSETEKDCIFGVGVVPSC